MGMATPPLHPIPASPQQARHLQNNNNTPTKRVMFSINILTINIIHQQTKFYMHLVHFILFKWA